MQRGQFAYHRKDQLCAFKWSDKWDVLILTSGHDPTQTVTTTSQNAVGEKEKPACVVDYTKNMCAVDQNDQFLEYLPLARRTMKWTKNIFMHMLTLSIVQADIIYNKIEKSKGKKTVTLPDFVKLLGKQMTEDYSVQRTTRDETPARQNKSSTLTSMNREQFHYLANLPATQSKAQPRRECKVCRDVVASKPGKTPRAKETHTWCAICEIPLCMGRCFYCSTLRQTM